MPPSKVLGMLTMYIYAFKKKAVLVVRIIGGSGGLKKNGEIFDLVFLNFIIGTWTKKIKKIFS
jgi:hypothetical protein